MTARPRPLRLRRVRWLARAALGLGVFVSVAANVLHAPPDPISRVIAAWPPLALLLTVELISRVPVDRPALAVARRAVTAGIAAIAAWMSYWHMVAVVARYGENGASAYLWPLSVDGLVVVASISLVELAGRIGVDAGAMAVGGTASVTEVLGTAVAQADESGPAVLAQCRTEQATTPTTRSTPTGSAVATSPADTGRGGAAAVVANLTRDEPSLSIGDIAARVGRSPRQVRRILASLPASDEGAPA